MKKVLLSIIIMVIISVSAKGQIYNYQFATGTYTDLTGATSLTMGQTWDDPDFIVPIGFNFPFWGVNRSTIYVTDGVVSFDPDMDTIMAVYLVDMIDRGSNGPTALSYISYKNEMVGSNNVFKLEYNNFGFFMEGAEYGTYNWYGNVQLWLYDNGTWEVHIGPSSIAEPFVAFFQEYGPAVGYGAMDNNFWLTGMAPNPTLVQHTTPTIVWMSSVPADGTIYRFMDLTSNVPQVATTPGDFAVFPNPVQNELGLDLPDGGTVELFEISGKRIMSVNYSEKGRYSIDLGSVARGTYIVSLTTVSGERTTKRIVKK